MLSIDRAGVDRADTDRLAQLNTLRLYGMVAAWGELLGDEGNLNSLHIAHENGATDIADGHRRRPSTIAVDAQAANLSVQSHDKI